MSFILRSMARIALLLFVSITIFSVNTPSTSAATTYRQPPKLHNISRPLNNRQVSLHRPHFTDRGGSKPCIPVCGTGNLAYGQYGNGSVQLQPKAYLIFWGPYWTTTTGKTDAAVVRNYFNDVSGTKFENILTQYYMINPNGSYSYISNQLQFVNDKTHVWIDSGTPPSDNSCGNSIQTIQDTSIRNEVTTAINSNVWPNNDENTTYFVYTPPSYAVNATDIPSGSCSNPNHFCGYHWGTSSTQNAVSRPFYAEIVYPGTPNIAACSSVPNQQSAGDPLANGSSHEQFETITDPELTGWDDPSLGRGGGEIGDKCAGNFTMDPTTLNNGGVFELQGEYSNMSHPEV